MTVKCQTCCPHIKHQLFPSLSIITSSCLHLMLHDVRWSVISYSFKPYACQCVITLNTFCFENCCDFHLLGSEFLVCFSFLYSWISLIPPPQRSVLTERSEEFNLASSWNTVLIFHVLNYASSWPRKYNHIFAWPFACSGDVTCSMFNGRLDAVF